MKKKGNIMTIVIFAIVLLTILFIGFIMVVGSSVVNWVFDVAYPELSNLGVQGDTNFTVAASHTITPLNSIVQSFTWLTGVIYVMALIGSVAFTFTMRSYPSRWLLGFYLLIMILMVMASIFISNMYEEFYAGTDEFASILKEHTLLSYMILYSPTVITIIGFITGIIMFSGKEGDSLT